MLNKHQKENRYCCACMKTTIHNVKDKRYSCQVCGSVKEQKCNVYQIKLAAILTIDI